MKTQQAGIPRSRRPVATGLLAGLLSVLLSVLLCGLPTGKAHAQLLIGSTTAAGFTGQAAAVSGVAAGAGVSVANTGGLGASGGAIGAAALGATLAGGVSVGASHAAVVGGGGVTASEASVANVHVAGGGGLLGGSTVVAANFVMARAAAASGTLVANASGAVQISGLVVNGQAVAVSGAANQIVLLANGGYLIINEQVAGVGGITVNALRVVNVLAGVNVVFGSATAGIILAPTPTPILAPPCDFLTGGGWITGTPSGAKANFGVGGGIKNGAYWGHLNYIDHGNGMHVKATAVTGYFTDPSDADCRIIDYAVTINGAPGTARVRACDKGEPGRHDVFQILLSNGYSAGGDLGGSRPGGGNIQLHNCH
jgi:hypothetical protein